MTSSQSESASNNSVVDSVKILNLPGDTPPSLPRDWSLSMERITPRPLTAIFYILFKPGTEMRACGPMMAGGTVSIILLRWLVRTAGWI